ncbi:helicase HerA domain-containing protein [Amycolatopsis sp. VS8301801F10]|uniref:ATP-binding protein n=1 Tax=Amycolatopsis sp. VS8301801F10 TaxID=2652442 RepID=UPI0038FC1634
MIEHLAVLATLRFDWADTPDHVWRDSPYHVDGLHADVMAAIDVGIRDAAASDGPSPIGLVMQGMKGVGKTHLLGMVRRAAHRAGGYFFLDDLTAGDAFWENTADALRRGLLRTDDSGETQLRSFVRRVCERGDVSWEATSALLGTGALTRAHLDAFVLGLRKLDRQVAVECADTARALVLYAAEDLTQNEIGDEYLGSSEESKSGVRRKWGIRAKPKSALGQVHDITRLLALTGPLVIGVDQLDTLIARSSLQAREIGHRGEEDFLVAQIADGLMELREVTRRTLTVLACLPTTWMLIKDKAADTVPDRFRETLTLGRVLDAEVGRRLVERRLGVAYAAMDFTPPHSTWPVAPSAFDGPWEEYTPRELLKRIGAHIDACVRAERVQELTSFDTDAPPVLPARAEPKPDRFSELDAWFEQLRAAADPSALLDHKVEDEVMPRLLSAALRGWITEVGDDEMEWDARGSEDELHAWLTHTLDEDSDLEEHWAFRAISVRHPLAVLNRFRKARSAAGLRPGADNRHLILIRNSSWSKGEKTQAELRAFEAAGGKRLKMSEADVRTFWALDEMFVKGGPDVHEWLIDRRPARRSQLLSGVLPDTAARSESRATPPSPAPQRPANPSPAAQPSLFTQPAPRSNRTGSAQAPRSDGTHPPPGGTVTLGTETGSGKPVRIELSALRKHAAVFAGSGSGKTVLLRRIIEECALLGVSSIVLDPNNDLARLGDAWPSPPSGWGPEDARLAERYLEDTDVVVWTPGRATGRPLGFEPLPDFAGVLDDEDEFSAAVEVAVAALAPQARLTGSTAKADIGLAVLRQTIVHHARTGSRSLPELIGLLEDLPDGVTNLNGGRKIAAEVAELLKAAMVNDPLFAGAGTPVDPAVLLTPAGGKRARISVISFAGLPAEAQRQSFVNQLQMELFAWIKRNPAGDRPLGALFVMDEAQTLAASGSLTASTRSTIVLAAQARKYGLGLLFATQAPKGLHNQIAGNAMTQFFGRLNSPAQIAAANEMARAKGSPVADISRLERAQFYVSGEAFGFRRVATPLCLSHHPASPLRLEEVLARARNGEGRGEG